MSKLVKRGCIALLSGTAISMIMGIQGAKADQFDDIINRCHRESQLRQLTPREIQICNLAFNNKRKQVLRNYGVGLLRDQSNGMGGLLEPSDRRVVPTNFGLGNNPPPKR